MGLEGVGFLWYTRRITPWAALGFIAGMGYQAEDTSASSMFQGSSGIPTTDSAFSIGTADKYQTIPVWAQFRCGQLRIAKDEVKRI